MASTESGRQGEDAEPASSAISSSSVTPPPDLEGDGGDEDADQGASGALIIASVLMSMSLLMAAYALGGTLDRAGSLFAGVLNMSDVALKRMIQNVTPPAPVGRADPAQPYVMNTAGSPSRGPETARVTVVEFSDFRCSGCARFTPTLRKLRKTYGDDVRIVFKHYPQETHERALPAHLAAEAAHRQGRFWDLHDKMFANQLVWAEEQYLEWAAEIGLDMARFKRDLASVEVKQRIDADVLEAKAMVLLHLPALFVNGHRVKDVKSLAEIKGLIDGELGDGEPDDDQPDSGDSKAG